MLENLPAKRVCRQIFPNLEAKKRVRKFMPVGTLARSRQQMHLKPTNAKANRNFKFMTSTQTTVNAIRKNISRRIRFFSSNSNEMVRSTRSARTTTVQRNSEETTGAISHGVVKTITRRTQRLFPKLVNSFRRPLQKRNLRNPASAKAEPSSTSIIDRMSKSKRVQVTLKKLDESIVDLVKLDDQKTVDAQDVESAETDAPVKRRTINRLIKSIRGKRAGSKKTSEKIEDKVVAETQSLEVKIEDGEVMHIVEVKETPSQIDETSQSSNRSGSSRKSSRNSIKKQKSIELVPVDVQAKENVVETRPGAEELKIVSTTNIANNHDVIAAESFPEEPMDLSKSKAKLSVPVAQDPIKTPPMKRRTRKLNDCIAMLTGKLQEKLGVPFINSEANTLLSPTKPDVTESAVIDDKEELQNRNDRVKMVHSPTKEPSSSNSTPTKRASRKDRSTNVGNDSPKANVVVMEPMTEIVNVIQPKSKDTVILEEKSEIVTSVEVAQTTAETLSTSSEGAVAVSVEVTSVDIPPFLSDNLLAISEEVHPLKAIKSTSNDPVLENSNPMTELDKTEPPTKRSAKCNKIKPMEELCDENKEDSCLSDAEAISKTIPADSAATVKTTKRKDTKKKVLQEATVTVDILEPPVLEHSSVDRAPKKRQTKNSSLATIDPLQDDKSSLTLNTSDAVEETKTISEELVEVTSKRKVGKGKGENDDTKLLDDAIDTKPIRRNSLIISTSPPDIEAPNDSVAQETDEKTIEDQKCVRKGRRSKKKSVVAETKLSEVVTPNTQMDKSKLKNLDSSDDEMHPWDPEKGFITADNPESASSAAPDAIENPPPPSCSEPIKEIIPVTDEKSATKKKRRKNELAKIIADQLLESFKEVDKSRIKELKLLHDLSIESNDDRLLSTSMSRTPPPKRRTASNIRNDAIVELDTSPEEVNDSENVDKMTSRRKRAIDSRKSTPNAKMGRKKKSVAPKSIKKDNKKKAADVNSSGYLSDTEVCQSKKSVTLRRRLTICDESPKRLSRNSKETEIPVSLFDSFKKRKNINEITTKQTPKDAKLKIPSKEPPKRKNKRNLLQQLTKDPTKNVTSSVEETVVEQMKISVKSSTENCDDIGKLKANVNDLVTQIINDFTTSTLNSPTTSPILFGDITKPRLNNTAAKLSSVLCNKKNILNGEAVTNGFKSDASKEITFATLSQPLKDKAVEQLRNTDSSSADAKQPFRAPFMSPRWDPADEWTGASKPIQDPALHKLWTLNNKDEQLSGEKKSLYQSVKEKTKKFLGKISRKKTRKHDGTLNNKKSATTVVGIKRPLLRPSILSVSNHTAKVDTVESENCLKKLESNSLFLGKICNFENDSTSKIFRNEKIHSTTGDRIDIATENELFGRKTDIDTTLMSNLKSNLDKEDVSKWKTEKKFDDNVVKCKNTKNDCKLPDVATIKNHSSKRNVKKKQKTTIEMNETKIVLPIVDGAKEDNAGKVTIGSAIKRRMGSAKRKTVNSVASKKLSGDLNQATKSKEDSTRKPATRTAKKIVEKSSTTKSFDESSQDTILSEIVNKIRDSNNDQSTESDEDLSLAEIAKNLNNKITNSDEFSNDGAVEPIELSESFVRKNSFSTLVAVLNDQSDAKKDEQAEETANCDDKSCYADGEDGEFMNDTNTDLIDMDLEDTASVYTSSMETTITTSGGSQKRRKRRHGRSILMKPSRKSKRIDGDFLTPGESFFCDLCSKTFRTQGGLATHRTTLTHISKLSEQEFKLKMETPKDVAIESKSVAEEDVTTKPDITKSPIIESSSQPIVPLNQSPSSVQHHVSVTSPIRNQSMTYLNNIEPISSPEQHDLNYDRYSTTSRPRTHAAPIHDSSRIALSQEQRFFYECCSMLKGSDRSTVNPSDSPNKYYTLPERSEVIAKPVTPRSNEQYSYVVPEGSKHSKGIPKIDLNQFSDISEDSNPAYSCPQNPSSSETQNIFPIESKRIMEKRDYHSTTERNFDSVKIDERTFNDRTTIIDREYLETYSDMGDSFPSSQDVSESEQYTQTILERSSNSVGLIRGGYEDSSSGLYGKNYDGNKRRRNIFTIAMESNEAKGFSNR